MVLQSKKLDVTERVTGKLKNGELELYLDNQPIGKMSVPLEGITMEPNFKATQAQNNQQRVILIVTKVVGVE